MLTESAEALLRVEALQFAGKMLRSERPPTIRDEVLRCAVAFDGMTENIDELLRRRSSERDAGGDRETREGVHDHEEPEREDAEEGGNLGLVSDPDVVGVAPFDAPGAVVGKGRQRTLVPNALNRARRNLSADAQEGSGNGAAASEADAVHPLNEAALGVGVAANRRCR